MRLWQLQIVTLTLLAAFLLGMNLLAAPSAGMRAACKDQPRDNIAHDLCR
jgi:hypothetical protein